MTTSHFDHVMIDIESMSLHPHNALILSIGLVEFDPTDIKGVKFGERLLILPNLEQQIALGRHVDPGTQKFWSDQKPEAREHWLDFRGERRALEGVCADIRVFCRNATRIWANGAQFDLSNIVGLADQIGPPGQPMWHYRAPRDMRTFVQETEQTRLTPADEMLNDAIIPHEPISDCIAQARQVWEHWGKS